MGPEPGRAAALETAPESRLHGASTGVATGGTVECRSRLRPQARAWASLAELLHLATLRGDTDSGHPPHVMRLCSCKGTDSPIARVRMLSRAEQRRQRGLRVRVSKVMAAPMLG